MKQSRSISLNLLTRYFTLTPIPESFSAVLGAPRDCVVVTQSQSQIVLGLLRSFAERSGRAGIQDARELFNAEAKTRDSERILWVSINDEATLEALGLSPANYLFSTFNIFHTRGPTSSNPAHRMGLRRLLSILFRSRYLVIVFGARISATESGGSRRMKLSRMLKLDFYKNLKVVRGTPFQPIEAQARAVLGGAEFERELGIVAQRGREDKNRLRKRAKAAFFDMAANPRAIVFWFIAPIANFMVRRLFSTVIVSGLDSFEAAVREKTVVVVPMHRSHLDYIILSSTLYQSRINPPIVAAGVNLSFWPVGFFIRSLGAYFVKRNARHDRLHALLLRRYVTYLVKRGHLQEFFIEGGRSRSGKMRPPKVGILSIIVDAFLKGLRKDILFVPVSLSYENVIEEKAFGDENTGQSKQKENVLALLKAGSIFKKQYGEVSVRFGEPLSLQQFWNDLRTRRGEGCDERNLVLEFANVLTRTIRDQTAVSLSSLAYTALMNAPRYALRRRELASTIRALAELSSLVREINPQVGEETPALSDFLRGNEQLLNDLPRGGTVRVSECLDEDVFFVPGKKRFTADFYRNATLHIYFVPSLLALLELLGRPIGAAEALTLHPLFEADFLLPCPQTFGAQVEMHIAKLRAKGILTEGESCKFSVRSPGIFTPGLLLGSAQSLLWVIQNLRNQSKIEGGGTSPLRQDRFMARLVETFKTGVYCGLVTRTEASSTAALTAALETLQQRKAISIQDGPDQAKEICILKDLSEEERLLTRINDVILEWQYREVVREL
ncbi:MAG: 1-acyl-sn-glycerol-3-phosphate acyltransferase [Deltaproteobacteria bacterium]|nr:1-acyl-sn-glycerol-3-phosphate acyltransferase [Deltaproteobacteria bacterium]